LGAFSFTSFAGAEGVAGVDAVTTGAWFFLATIFVSGYSKIWDIL